MLPAPWTLAGHRVSARTRRVPLTHMLRTPPSSKEATWNDRPDISNENRQRDQVAGEQGKRISYLELRTVQKGRTTYLLEKKRVKIQNSVFCRQTLRQVLLLAEGCGGLQT